MRTNVSLKILALIIAILIWLQVNLLKHQEIKMKLPVRVINVPENIYVSKQDSLRLNFQVEGEGIVLLLFYLSNPYLEYDASTLSIGKNSLTLEKFGPFFEKYKQLNFKLLDHIEKSSLSAERIVQKKVPIQLNFESPQVKETFYAQQIDADERSVMLSGPLLDIQKIDIINTEPITESMIKENRKIKFENISDKILLIPSQLTLIKQKQSTINRTFNNIPIELSDKKISIFPDRVSVIVEGKQDTIKVIDASHIKAFVKNDEGDIEVRIDHQNIKIIDFTPQKVRIKKKD